MTACDAVLDTRQAKDEMKMPDLQSKWLPNGAIVPMKQGKALAQTSSCSKVPAKIETYSYRGAGYCPYLIRDGWQVAQLNYVSSQSLAAIRKMDRHLATDEAFVLIKGASVLIAGEETATGMRFEAVRMLPGLTYNIPVNGWHNIAMQKGDQVIIVEKALTHEGDFEFRNLNAIELRNLRRAVSQARKGAKK